MTALASQGRRSDGPLAMLVALAVVGLADPATATESLVVLIEDLLAAYEGPSAR
jgi:hypothetical protein